MRASLHRPGLRSFTLIELLTVIAIMVIMASLSVPFMKGLSGAGSLSGAGNIVSGLVDQARQNAMAQNQPTAVVVVTSAGANPNYNYRTLALYQFHTEADAATGAASNYWAPLTPWTRLGSSLLFDTNALATGLTSFFTNSTNNAGGVLPFLTNNQGIALERNTNNQLAFLVFLPTGQLFGQLTPVLLRLGYAHSATTNNYYDVIINNDTGRVKVIRP